MESINSFTFYRNYYDIIKYLSDEDKLKMLNAILEFVFEDKEPTLEGLNLGIWENIKMPLNTTKKNIINGKKGGRPKTQNKTQKKPKAKPKNKPKSKANNISYFYFLFSNINILNKVNKDNIYKLLEEYLEVRRDRKYVLSESVIKRLISKLNEYGKTDEAKEEIITKAINGAWKDFYPLEGTAGKPVPDWFDKDIQSLEATKEEEEEMNKILEAIA